MINIFANKRDYSFEEIKINKNEYKQIYTLTDEVQDEWDDVLQNAPITKIVSEGYVGLATKYLVIFETGHIAIAKLVEPFSLFNHEWETITFENIPRYEAKESSYYSRSGRKFQAWTEVAAYYVSRIAFPVAKKPPAMIRAISSDLLYQCEGCTSYLDYFKSLLPKHTVYISVHAFVYGLHIKAPSTTMMEYLTATPMINNGHFSESYNDAKYVSDVIIFDFLLDDHDRKRSHNWMLDGNDKLLLWDSGLCFQHGPIGRSSCKDLLCGPEKWTDHGKHVYNLKKCAKTCRFRNETISRLRSLSTKNNIENLHNTLGNLVKNRVEDIGTPVFDWNLYYQFSQGYPKVKFQISDFYKGLDIKLDKLLDHVDYCYSKYGDDIYISK